MQSNQLRIDVKNMKYKFLKFLALNTNIKFKAIKIRWNLYVVVDKDLLAECC